METKRAKDIRRLAEREFAKHECKQILDAGDFRAWRCGVPDSGINAFTVYAVPGRLILSGDLGLMAFERVYDMVPWIQRNLRSTGYIASKVPQEIKRKEFSHEVAELWITETRAEILADEDGIWNDPGRGDALRQLDDLQAALDECEHDFMHELREAQGILFDEWPDCEDYTSGFYWAVHCIEWWLQAIGQPAEAA